MGIEVTSSVDVANLCCGRVDECGDGRAWKAKSGGLNALYMSFGHEHPVHKRDRITHATDV